MYQGDSSNKLDPKFSLYHSQPDPLYCFIYFSLELYMESV